jgi:CspA family cold shock protein
MHGMIKRLFPDKGFGFLRGEDGVERFFHREDCLTDFTALHDGLAVEFGDAPPGRKGPRAKDVRAIAED